MKHLVSFGFRTYLAVHPVKQEGFDQDQQNQIQGRGNLHRTVLWALTGFHQSIKASRVPLSDSDLLLRQLQLMLLKIRLKLMLLSQSTLSYSVKIPLILVYYKYPEEHAGNEDYQLWLCSEFHGVIAGNCSCCFIIPTGSMPCANFILYLQLRKYRQPSSSFIPLDISHTAISPYEIYII